MKLILTKKERNKVYKDILEQFDRYASLNVGLCYMLTYTAPYGHRQRNSIDAYFEIEQYPEIWMFSNSCDKLSFYENSEEWRKINELRKTVLEFAIVMTE